MKKILSLCLLAALLMTGPAWGQPDVEGDEISSDVDEVGQDRAWGKRGHGGPEVLAEFDGDGDGKLDETERAAAKEAMDARHQEMIAQFDTDGDGKLSGTERQAMHAVRKLEMEKKFDADGDGVLSDAEKTTMREAMKGRMGPRGSGSRPDMSEFDTDGDGQLSDTEKAAAKTAMDAKRQERMKAMDTDGDGTVSDAERKAVQGQGRHKGPKEGSQKEFGRPRGQKGGHGGGGRRKPR